MKPYEFGPSYVKGTWVRVRNKKWGQILSVYWTGDYWCYKIYLEDSLETLEISEEDILF